MDVLLQVSVSLSLCLSLSVCCVLCVVVVEEGGEEEKGETNRTTWLLIPARAASLKIAETEQLYQVKGTIGGTGDMLFSIYSQTGNVQDPRVSFVNLWGQVITLRGQTC